MSPTPTPPTHTVPRIEQGKVTIIDANPGSGKTTSIIASMVRAADDWSVPPERMLAVTFGKKMALELASRCNDRGLTGIAASTLHAFCHSLVRKDPQRFGLATGIEILGTREESYLRNQYKQYFGSKPPIPAKLLTEAVDAWYNENIEVSDFLREEAISDKKIGDERIGRVVKFLKHYSKTKKWENKIGFGDMIQFVLEQLTADATYRRRVCRQYQFFAVDEYQDMNAQERELVQLLAKHIGTVLIVGDDLQVLHTYRGANINALAELKARFDKAKVISLDQSHRLTVESAALVNKVLSHNKHHDTQIKGKGHGPLPQVFAANSRNQTYEQAAQEIEKLTAEGVKPEDIAVLTRFKRSYQTFARYLDRAAIPFTLGDDNDQRHKLLLKFRRFLRAVIEDKSDKALRILLQKITRLDQNTAAQLTDLTKQIPAKKLGLTDKQHKLVRKIRDAVKQARLKPTVDRALHIFAYAIQGRQDRFKLTPIQHVLRIEGVQYDHETTLKELHRRVKERVAKGPSKQGVTLSTIHAAKGKEWKHVLVLDIYDENLSGNGQFSTDDEAEFRVFHVAMTRAKRQTHLFLLKHEAPEHVVFRNRKEKHVTNEIGIVNKYKYSTLRFLPPYKEVMHLCSYQRCKPIKLEEKRHPPRSKTPAKGSRPRKRVLRFTKARKQA